jgi:hypothetical protein
VPVPGPALLQKLEGRLPYLGVAVLEIDPETCRQRRRGYVAGGA